jgi:hypothetical protein
MPNIDVHLHNSITVHALKAFTLDATQHLDEWLVELDEFEDES